MTPMDMPWVIVCSVPLHDGCKTAYARRMQWPVWSVMSSLFC